jgi:transcription-repair coupling factor (superfamily II helicase)
MTASHEFEHERLMVMSGLLSGEYDVVFTTPHAALGYTIPPSVLGERMIKIDMQTRSEPSDLAERLVAAGYTRVDLVEVAGQFAARGGIVDIFSPNAEIKDSEGQIRRGAFPVRIEFFDDEIDRMGVFDSDSQRMLYNITSVSFTPAREVLLGKEEKERMEKAIRQRFKESHDEKACETLTREVTALTGDLSDVGFADKYISLIYPEKTCLFDYFD